MSTRVQDYIHSITAAKADEFLKVYESVPADKRHWSPGGKARTAANMVAEIALLNPNVAETIKTFSFDMNFDFAGFGQNCEKLAANEAELIESFKSGVAALLDAIKNLPDDQIETVVQFPWGPMTIAQILIYPHWNMGYHEGQINTILQILEVE